MISHDFPWFPKRACTFANGMPNNPIYFPNGNPQMGFKRGPAIGDNRSHMQPWNTTQDPQTGTRKRGWSWAPAPCCLIPELCQNAVQKVYIYILWVTPSAAGPFWLAISGVWCFHFTFGVDTRWSGTWFSLILKWFWDLCILAFWIQQAWNFTFVRACFQVTFLIDFWVEISAFGLQDRGFR